MTSPFETRWPSRRPARVPLKVGVVVAELFGRIELVDGDPASLAVEEPGDGAVLDRDDRRVPRRAGCRSLRALGIRRRGVVRSGPSSRRLHVDVVIVDRQPEVVPAKNSDRIGADRLASDRRLDHARRVGRHGPGRLAGRFVDVAAGFGDGRFGMRLADRRANPPARRHAGVEAGDERGNRHARGGVPSGSFENHGRPRSHERREPRRVPIGQAHAAVRLRVSDFRGLRCAVDAVMLLVDIDPDRRRPDCSAPA